MTKLPPSIFKKVNVMMINSNKMKGWLLTLAVSISSVMMGQTAETVSDTELKQFVTAFENVQQENQKAQQLMMTIISEEGLEVARFSEIQRASITPDLEVNTSEEEMASYKKIMSKIEGMEPSIEERMIAHVTASGLDVERYQAIAVALQKDKGLQERFQGIMQ
jgi:hypothetical protein